MLQGAAAAADVYCCWRDGMLCVLLMALLVLNSWPLTIIARYQLSHCITFGHYCSNKAERLRDRLIYIYLDTRCIREFLTFMIARMTFP